MNRGSVFYSPPIGDLSMSFHLISIWKTKNLHLKIQKIFLFFIPMNFNGTITSVLYNSNFLKLSEVKTIYLFLFFII